MAALNETRSSLAPHYYDVITCNCMAYVELVKLILTNINDVKLGNEEVYVMALCAAISICNRRINLSFETFFMQLLIEMK